MTSPVLDSMNDEYVRRFAGIGRVYGETRLTTFEQAHVMVIGVGGVGSWAAEALARTAIGEITLVDMDILVASNINRQLPALTDTLGLEKTQAMAERIRGINPRIKLNIIDDFLTADNLVQMLATPPDVVLDCIDDVKAKLALILHCRRHKIPLVVSGSAGGKTDPLSIRVADLSKTEYDPLLAKIRRTLRQDYNMCKKPKDKFGVTCVYSIEQPYQPETCTTGGLQCGGYGSATVMTASVGLVAVAEVLKKLK
jgi:tRNA A37 threonylcarbamoyladenosine dehydratase